MFSKLKINFVPGLLNTGFYSFFTPSVTANVNRDRLAKVAILIPFLSSSLMIISFSLMGYRLVFYYVEYKCVLFIIVLFGT